MPQESAGTRERILGCAADLFGKHGYDGVAVADIASACGISTSLIYYHFKDKESLYSALTVRVTTELVQPALGTLGAGGTPRERIEAFVDAWIKASFANPDFIGMHIQPLSNWDSPAVAEKLAAASQMIEAIASVIAEGIEAGEFDPVDPLLAAECLMGLVNTRAMAGAIGAPHSRLVKSDVEQTSAFITRLFVRGIGTC